MKVHRETLAAATDEQLIALRDKVLCHWQHIPDDGIRVYPEILGQALMVDLKAPDQDSAFTVGIEPDGYVHS